MPSLFRTLALMLGLLAVAITLTGCVSMERESDLNWQKYNPNYHPVHPDQSGHEWGW